MLDAERILLEAVVHRFTNYNRVLAKVSKLNDFILLVSSTVNIIPLSIRNPKHIKLFFIEFLWHHLQ